MRKHAFVDVKPITLITSYISNADHAVFTDEIRERHTYCFTFLHVISAKILPDYFVLEAFVLLWFLSLICVVVYGFKCFEKFIFGQKPNKLLLRALII